MQLVSLPSKRSPEILVDKRAMLVLVIGASLALGIYLLASILKYRLGFPLDDSWIHQTYARNLATHGEWAFLSGKPSSGSTSPLWSALLAFGFWLGLSPYYWTFLLGCLILWALAVLCENTARQLLPGYPGWFPWVGLFIVGEWHLTWSAGSGMETLLHTLIVTAVLAAIMTGKPRYLALGLLIGISVWIRPDGLTLLGPVALVALLTEKTNSSRLGALTRLLFGFGSLFVPYLLFNLILSGSPMPNTFYAKQAEYAFWQVKPVSIRLTRLILQWSAGLSVVIFPGVIGWLVISFRRRDWGTLAGVFWCFGYILLYALRLPIYQHGRYVIPAMPIYFLWGLMALLEFGKSNLFSRFHRAINLSWQSIVFFVWLGFWVLGARAYAEDVAYIESEMVVSARWVADNLPPDALVAAHDIGALGYFGHHDLIDMAGLVSPEVIPFIKDEVRLAAYLDARGADYLIAFPDVYPRLIIRATPVYCTQSTSILAMGEEDMVVYRWNR